MELTVGSNYGVTVKRILDKVGIIVEMEDKSTELIHISNIAPCYVADINHFVSVGDEYVARCEEGKDRPVQLTLKHLQLASRVFESKTCT